MIILWDFAEFTFSLELNDSWDDDWVDNDEMALKVATIILQYCCVVQIFKFRTIHVDIEMLLRVQSVYANDGAYLFGRRVVETQIP